MNIFKKYPTDLKITLIYIIVGAFWILYSDKAMRAMFANPEDLRVIELYKGWFYVVVTGILLFVLIRSELKEKNRIHAELEKAKLKAEESNRLKTAFLSNMSHYLRTPMNSILGFVDILKRRNLDDEKREKFLSIVNEQSHHLLQFIDNIIEISKLQEGQTTLNIKEFSANELIEKIHKRYNTELEYFNKSAKIKLQYTCPRNDSFLTTDPEKLEYILSNLLSNSLKFTHQGEIRFGMQIHNESADFYVMDTGSGIPADKQEYIINTFMHEDPDLSKENIGSGLGMALTVGFIKLLKGKLWLEKSNSEGTHFCFTIPVVLS